MLQQTQVAAVIPYFERWMRRFPDVAALAAATEAEVLRHWAGLGYYARARNLHRAAAAVAKQGRFPEDAAGWLALPGVGAYTAGAVASLACGNAEPILDGNVTRVFSRLFGLAFLPGDGSAQRQAYWELAGKWARGKSPGDANEALMELGALICTPASPDCGHCPAASFCQAQARGWQNRLPPAKPRPRTEFIRGFALVATHRGRVLLEKRPADFLAGHFLFPLLLAGAKTPRTQWKRRFPGLQSLVEIKATVRHSIMHRRYALEVWKGELSGSSARTNASNPERKWVPYSEVSDFLTNSLARKIWRATDIPRLYGPRGKLQQRNPIVALE
jgi:A/G-specific adenine glycosylase